MSAAQAGAGTSVAEPPAHPAGRRELPDEVLVARASGGDVYAFERLVRRYQQQMYLVAFRLVGDRDDAEDATQNAFIAVWRKLPEFRAEASFSTWLYRIVTNHSLNLVRAGARRQQHADLSTLTGENEPASQPPGPQQHAEQSALLAAARAALAGMPADLRVCWLTREVDRCSYQEVATIAGVSIDTARGRIYRARQQLAQALEAWR